jgi:hypothetical protein
MINKQTAILSLDLLAVMDQLTLTAPVPGSLLLFDRPPDQGQSDHCARQASPCGVMFVELLRGK